MALDTPSFLMSAPTDAQGLMYLNSDPSVVVDNVMHFNIDGQIWTRIAEKGVYKASWAVQGTGTQIVNMQTVVNAASVKELCINTPVLLSGTLTIPAGKKVSFEGEGKFTGTAIVNGGVYPRLRPTTHYAATITVNPEEVWDTGSGGSGADTAPPFIVNASVISPLVVRLSLNETVQYTNANGLSIGSPTSNPITAIAGTGTAIVDLTLTNPIQPGALVQFSYVPASGDLRDLANNEMNAVINLVVTNSLSSPILEGSLFGSTVGTSIQVGSATDTGGTYKKMPGGTTPDN